MSRVYRVYFAPLSVMGAILLSTQAMAAITPKSDTPDGHKKRNSKNARLPNKVVSNKTDIAS
ncbi:MAG: hypothetical protein ABF471_12150, partial [Acetobacter orientalis]